MAGNTDREMIVGLDIGTSKIVTIVGEVTEDGPSMPYKNQSMKLSACAMWKLNLYSQELLEATSAA